MIFKLMLIKLVVKAFIDAVMKAIIINFNCHFTHAHLHHRSVLVNDISKIK